ncbi:hypothetical protein Ancab_019813 [Ancistrocladus abbreviatus]
MSKSVKELIPTSYVMHRNAANKTAQELFEENHKEKLKEAQKWTRDTAYACSTVSAIIATVVFAGAYSAPGSNATYGTRNFVENSLFAVFVISELVSLISALTSLVLFLTIVAFPLHMQDFHEFIPQMLMLGFICPFVSVVTAMVTFTTSILLAIQQGKWQITTLTYTIGFLALSFFLLVLLLIGRFRGRRFRLLKIG